MIYVDTSCLVKLIRPAETTSAIAGALDRESEIIVSTLAELESLIELKAGYMAGDYSLARWRMLEAQLYGFRNEELFIFKGIPHRIWETAFRQHRNSGGVHCRTLDRLHLAAMEDFGTTRLMSHDIAQGKAAQALGFEVISPGR
jgi:predicted nucleic acid-binding protein